MDCLTKMLLLLLSVIIVSQFSFSTEHYPPCPELSSEDSIWDDSDAVQTNNCYAYAFRNLAYNRKGKPQPGFLSGNLPPLSKHEYTCENFRKRILADHKDAEYMGMEMPDCQKDCRFGVYLALDNKGEDRDYHLYRQNSDGYWSHKPGALDVHHVDSNNEIISDPSKSARKSGKYDYSTSCGFFCVK
jgi:hypothetical protein